MRRFVVPVVVSTAIITLGLAGTAQAGQGGVGPCTGGTPVALATAPGPELGRATRTAASDPESLGFDSAAEVVATIHATFCAANTPGG